MRIPFEEFPKGILGRISEKKTYENKSEAILARIHGAVVQSARRIHLDQFSKRVALEVLEKKNRGPGLIPLKILIKSLKDFLEN